jgi:hypothetical protein
VCVFFWGGWNLRRRGAKPLYIYFKVSLSLHVSVLDMFYLHSDLMFPGSHLLCMRKRPGQSRRAHPAARRTVKQLMGCLAANLCAFSQKPRQIHGSAPCKRPRNSHAPFGSFWRNSFFTVGIVTPSGGKWSRAEMN